MAPFQRPSDVLRTPLRYFLDAPWASFGPLLFGRHLGVRWTSFGRLLEIFHV